MAKFNAESTIRTQNKCGNPAYRMDDKSKLVSQVLTSFFNEDKFYGDNTKEMQALIEKTVERDPGFVSRLAVFARREFNMRSVSHVLTAYLAHTEQGKPFVRDTMRGVCLRADDLTEIMAFYLSAFGKPIPNALKKGTNDVLLTLDEYALAKYKGEGKSVKMRDLLCLCRPCPKNNEQAALWKKCLDGSLETPYTWETELSAKGNTKEVWEDLISSGKVGYMALLRNLRNIIKAKPSNIENVYETLRDPAKVRKSRLLPFRFIAAYKSVQLCADSRVYDVLEDAVDASIANLPQLPGKTAIAVDVSGSMSSAISKSSEIRCYEIAVMLGLIVSRLSANNVFYVFNNQITKAAISSRVQILDKSTHFSCRGGTDISLPFRALLNDRVDVDRVIVFSDNECNSPYRLRAPVQTYADEYRRNSGKNIWVHAVDLQGYGTQQFCGSKTNVIAGWSEKIVEFIRLAEEGEGTILSRITEYSW